jgi:hypothetical protein
LMRRAYTKSNIMRRAEAYASKTVFPTYLDVPLQGLRYAWLVEGERAGTMIRFRCYARVRHSKM